MHLPLTTARLTLLRGGLLDDQLLVIGNSDKAVLGTCWRYPSWFDGAAPDDTDLGYRFGRAFRGQGQGLEAAAEVQRWATEERGRDRVGSDAPTLNVASHKFLRRLGCTFLETLSRAQAGPTRSVPALPSPLVISGQFSGRTSRQGTVRPAPGGTAAVREPGGWHTCRAPGEIHPGGARS